METSKIKTAIIVVLFICLGIFATCEFTKQVQLTSEPILQDTIFLSQWRKEKQEKLDLITYYEKELTRLQKDNDSMQVLVSESKKAVSAYRFKANYFGKELKEAIGRTTPKDSLGKDTLSPILDSLLVSQNQSDSACDATIQILENSLANRDSSLLFHKQVEFNLKEIQKDQELKSDYLTEQLNNALKSHQKKSRQNKLLKGGILILSGITTSLIITQRLKQP